MKIEYSDNLMMDVQVRKNKLGQITLIVDKAPYLSFVSTETEFLKTSYKEMVFNYEPINISYGQKEKSSFKLIIENDDDRADMYLTQLFISSSRKQDIIIFVKYEDIVFDTI